MQTRTVLLISRGTMSGGRLIGECLGEHQGIRCLTREDLLATIDSYGELASRIAAQVEKATLPYEEFCRLRRPYKILMKQALLQHARQGGLAYLGHSGHMLLEREPQFIRVRLIASMQLRVAVTKREMGYSDADALAYIRRVDQDRAQWARWIYGIDIRDPELYDVCLNLDRLSTEGACRLLDSVMQQPDFQPTPESIDRVERDYAATQVLAALALDPRTAELEFSAVWSGGGLQLSGPKLDDRMLKIAREIAGSLPGVSNVDYKPENVFHEQPS